MPIGVDPDRDVFLERLADARIREDLLVQDAAGGAPLGVEVQEEEPAFPASFLERAGYRLGYLYRRRRGGRVRLPGCRGEARPETQLADRTQDSVLLDRGAVVTDREGIPPQIDLDSGNAREPFQGRPDRVRSAESGGAAAALQHAPDDQGDRAGLLGRPLGCGGLPGRRVRLGNHAEDHREERKQAAEPVPDQWPGSVDACAERRSSTTRR